MSKYTYISSSIFACSCGGQLVQLPGSECVNPATRRPASIFFAISIFNCRDEPGPPALNFIPGSWQASAHRTFPGQKNQPGFAVSIAEGCARYGSVEPNPSVR